MKELKKPELNPTGLDMIRFLETYKRGVDYYNSYGLDEKTKGKRAVKNSTNNSSPTGTFWDLNRA